MAIQGKWERKRGAKGGQTVSNSAEQGQTGKMGKTRAKETKGKTEQNSEKSQHGCGKWAP